MAKGKGGSPKVSSGVKEIRRDGMKVTPTAAGKDKREVSKPQTSWDKLPWAH